MKKILITGANSYIGTSFSSYLEQYAKEYCVDTLDTIGNAWKDADFSEYDSIFHVAGIAHQKETEKNADLYYRVNRDLVCEVAKKAKDAGVKQFVFLSSMSVYGVHTGVITKETLPAPRSHYGKSKLEAEEKLNQLSGDAFLVAILRPPMVYGEGCKGNYQLLKKFALKSPIFPNIQNQRSMIRIDRLCEAVKQVIDHQRNGIFFPQDPDYICTSDMVLALAQKAGKKIYLTKAFNPIIRSLKLPVIQKVFGDLIYDKNTMQ